LRPSVPSRCLVPQVSGSVTAGLPGR
jgi:hypothetical protein